jgi:hypothetical protein
MWWRLHEAVTRNHRCRTIEERLDLTFDWFANVVAAKSTKPTERRFQKVQLATFRM